jgi:hypothetical protein
MKVQIDPAYYPAPGVTLSPDYLHGLVDTATLSDFQMADFSDLAIFENPFLDPTGTELFRYEASVVSLADSVWSQLLQKSNLHYYQSDQAGYKPVKGLPAFIPDDGMNQHGNWSGWTAYKVSDWWYLPRISLSQKYPYNYFHNTSYPSGTGSMITIGIIGLSKDDNEGIVPVVMYGMTEALVHAALSEGATLPGSVFELFYHPTQRTMFPRCMHYTDYSAYTAVSWPLGICRRVYVESGITEIGMLSENMSGVSLVPYYVAEVFLGGYPCL